MKSSQLGLGIVGTGMIADMIADAIAKSKHARLGGRKRCQEPLFELTAVS